MTERDTAPAPDTGKAAQASDSDARNDVWFFAEHRDGKLEDSAFRLATEARTLADKLGGTTFALLVGGGDLVKTAGSLAPYGIDNAFVAEYGQLYEYSGEAYADVLAQLVRAGNPAVVLFAATTVGNDLAPRLAARLRAAFAGCYTEIEVARDRSMSVRKSIHGGNASSTSPVLRKPLVATIDAQTLTTQKAKEEKEPCLIEPRIAISPRSTRTKVIDYLKADPCAVCPSEAEVVIGVGKGLGSAENLEAVEELARLLGASIGASRRATDEKWVADERRIGLTGKTIAPRLYLVCGISGAFHHTLSIKGSQLKVAINTDEKAPISSMADLMVVGDMQKVIPELVKKLREVAKSTS